MKQSCTRKPREEWFRHVMTNEKEQVAENSVAEFLIIQYLLLRALLFFSDIFVGVRSVSGARPPLSLCAVLIVLGEEIDHPFETTMRQKPARTHSGHTSASHVVLIAVFRSSNSSHHAVHDLADPSSLSLFLSPPLPLALILVFVVILSLLFLSPLLLSFALAL